VRHLSALAVSACALWAALAPAVTSADASPRDRRAMIAFLPTEQGQGLPLLFAFADRGWAYGVTSPTIGRYDEDQMALDVGQGSRISRRAYDDELGPLRLERGPGGWRVAGFEAAAERAEDAPGEVVPGLLASIVERGGGGPVGYVGVAGDKHVQAAAAADRSGRLGAVSLGEPGDFADRALFLWRTRRLVVARLPREGLGVLDRIAAARLPGDLVYVVRLPLGEDLGFLPTEFLPTGVSGPRFGRSALRSDTTRRDGIVAATDVAPTVLDHLGLEAPDEMEGQVVEDGADITPEEILDRVERFDVVVGRRTPWLLALVGSFAALLAAGALVAGRRGVGAVLRASFLALLWLPGIALLTSAIAPSRAVEVVSLSVGALALGALTDRLVRWPIAPAVPAGIAFGAHAIDLAFGSHLIGASLGGSSPKGGARFYGVGNELEAMLSMGVILGLGAALTQVPPRHAPRLFALGCLAAAAILGSGRLGADVGAVITLGAAGAGAVLASLGRPPSRRAVAVAVAVPVLGIALLIGVDLATAGGAHLSRTVVGADSPGDLLDVAARRFKLSWRNLAPPGSAVLFALGLAVLAWGVAHRDSILAAVRDQPAFAAGMWGALAATVVGALGNDSGPLIFQVGSITLALAAGYAWARPDRVRNATSNRIFTTRSGVVV
jgi:hypothetical protein